MRKVGHPTEHELTGIIIEHLRNHVGLPHEGNRYGHIGIYKAENSAVPDGGPHSRVCGCLTHCSAPHRQQTKMFLAHMYERGVGGQTFLKNFQ